MAKCLNCNSCLRKRNISDKKYLYCDFCGKVFVVDKLRKSIKEIKLFDSKVGGRING